MMVLVCLRAALRSARKQTVRRVPRFTPMIRPRDPSYSNSQPDSAEHFTATGIPEGVISASLVVLALVAIVIGAIVGIVLGTLLPSGSRLIALPAGFIATVVASVARYKLVGWAAPARINEARIPIVLVVNAAIASVAGSLTAHDLMGFVGAE